MDSPETQLATLVVPSLLCTDTALTERTVDLYTTPDMTFHHPAFIVQGRENVKKMYICWSMHNLRFVRLAVDDLYFNSNKSRAVLDIDYEFAPIWFLGLVQRVRVITILHLRQLHDDTSHSTKWYISRQEDYYPTDTILSTLTPRPFSSLTQNVAQLVMRYIGLFCITVGYVVFFILSGVAEAFGLRVWKPRPERLEDKTKR
ncbi:hypothetical protein HDV00_008602 [Rhizophlyctis rosea]|nr:hypothetical protein HDV00_008602 [Rhizophlyctis rosea]